MSKTRLYNCRVLFGFIYTGLRQRIGKHQFPLFGRTEMIAVIRTLLRNQNLLALFGKAAPHRFGLDGQAEEGK